MQKKQTATSGSQKKIDKYFLLKLRKKTQIKKKIKNEFNPYYSAPSKKNQILRNFFQNS